MKTLIVDRPVAFVANSISFFVMLACTLSAIRAFRVPTEIDPGLHKFLMPHELPETPNLEDFLRRYFMTDLGMGIRLAGGENYRPPHEVVIIATEKLEHPRVIVLGEENLPSVI